MNITLSIDEKIVGEAREAAAAMGKSLNEVTCHAMLKQLGLEYDDIVKR